MTADHLSKERIQEIMEALPSFVGEQPHLQTEQASLRQLLADYFRLVEIAHYVRRGGVRLMLYRLETGKTEFVDVDYFDEAHARLTCAYGQLYSAAEANHRTVLERLRDITPEEEDAVRAILPELDNIVLKDKRLEAVLADEQLESR